MTKPSCWGRQQSQPKRWKHAIGSDPKKSIYAVLSKSEEPCMISENIAQGQSHFITPCKAVWVSVAVLYDEILREVFKSVYLAFATVANKSGQRKTNLNHFR